MLRITILILFTVCSHSLFATVYYVGGTGSSDSNPGTATQPFATIQKAASIAVAGDIVNIRAGVYRETVVPTNSGSPGNPIIFQAEGGAVVINGADQVSSAWTVHNGNIYKTSITLPVNGYQTSITSNTTILANQVFKDRVMMFEARWPDYSTLDDLLDRTKVRSLAQSVSFGSTSITDNGFPQTSLAGGVMWFVGWMSSGTRVINSHSGNTITFNTVNPDQRFRQFFYVTGKLGLLNVEKEWHYENNTLYLWQPGGGAPTNVEYKARNFGFNLTNKANITIKGLEFFACEPMTGNTNSTGITLDGIKAKYTNHSVMQVQTGDVNNNNAKQTGIKLIGSNSIIKNSEIQYSASQGIWLGENCVAHNNLIKDNNYEGNYAAAITPWINTNNQKITYNTITRTGRSPIYVGGSGSEFGSHTNMDIGYNDLSVYGMLNVDLGAVYGDLQTNLTGTRVHHNWVYDSRARLFDEGIQTGIYFDQYSGPVTIDHNVCWNNVTADFYVEKNKVNYLYNNVFATTTGGRSYVTYRNTPSDVQRNNIYRGDLSLSGGGDPGNIQNSLYKNIDPQFVGTGNGGLVYRLKPTSPGVNAGTPISGITDGSSGVPDIGAYEIGAADWIPGYTPQSSTTPNTPPVVSITTPANNTSYVQGVAVNISVNASDGNGTLKRVEFFDGTTKIGEDLSFPYTFTWTNASAGAHTLTARATDNEDAVTTSTPVTITVTQNTAPAVQITAPAGNLQFNIGSTITITATATDANGSVSKVEFFDGTTKLGEDLSTPYSFVWTNGTIGVHTLTAKATDNENGITTSAPVIITINNPLPTVSLTSPSSNSQIITGAPITITATASDANGSITKVEFFNGATKLGEDLTSPFSFVWNNAPIGVHSLTAKATDNDGNIATSAVVSVTISVNPPPTISITSPAANAQIITGTPITITATASDANGSISKVEFFRGATKLGEDLTSPYSFVWNNAAVGGYSITAKATDNENNIGTSAAVSIAVNANPPPNVLITGPSNNNLFTTGAPVNITATASDTNGAITKVEFFNGTTKLGEDATIPYNFQWTNAPKGSHTLIAKATDNQAASASSAAVIINIIDANVPPTIGITSPLSNTRFTSGSSITIAASAADANGSITKVEFFQGTTKLGEDATSPYSFVWANVPAGNYSLSAKATDNQNASAASSSVSIIVNTAPTISFQTPANNSSFNAGSTITFTAIASDPNGTVSNVEFFNGTTKLGQDLTAPYTFAWVNVPAGTYSIIAKATDNQNAATSTQPLAISVVSLVPVPPPNIVSPTANAGEDVTLSLPENSVTLTALEIPQGETLQFKWVQISGPSTVTISNPTSKEIQIAGLIAGVYVMELTVKNNTTGLSSADLVQISVIDDIPVQALQTSIPRFFSPNDDGKGDFWEWKNVDKFENSILTVFNRSGQKIYETMSYKNNWNGKVGNTPLQAGDYYYIIQLINNTFIKGALQIIR